MTDPLADILQAVSVGHGMTSNGAGFAKSQSWRNALEKAHVQNEWIMQAAHDEAGGKQELSPRSPELQPLETTPRLGPSVQRPEASPRQQLQAGRDTAVSQSTKLTVSTVAASSRFSNAVPGAGQSLTQISMVPARNVAPAKSAAPPTLPNQPSASPGPRSVHLFTVNGSVHVVIRDETLKGPLLPKLVARIRELMTGFGEEVSKIVINGLDVWNDPAKPGLPSEENSQKTIEILF